MRHLTAMPLVWISVLFLAGIVLAGSWPAPVALWLAGGALFTACLLIEKRLAWRVFRRDKILPAAPVPLSSLLAALFCGALIYQINQPAWDSSDLAWYNGRPGVEVNGWVAEVPILSDKTVSLSIEAQSIRLRGDRPVIPVSGRVMVRTAAGGDYCYGDRLRIRGSLVQPPGNETFSYREFLARKGIYSWLAGPEISRLEGKGGSALMRSIFGLRERLEENIRRMLPPDEAGLLIGVLLGNDKGLPAEAREAFRETGTSHILAVSGFNISVLVALAAAFFKRFVPRLWSLLPVFACIAVFSLMVGGQASVVRAAVMGCTAQAGLAIGRRPSGGSALVFSAAVMSLFNPSILWDIGFQLSFTATLGILLWGDPLSEAAVRFCGRLFPPSVSARVAGWAAEFVLITLAAQVFTFPVSIYHFQTFSWAGLFANPLILPAQQLLMMLGGLAAILSLVFFPLGQLLVWCAWPFCAYTLACARILAESGEGAWSTGAVSVVFAAGYYAAILLLPLIWKRALPVLKRSAWPAALLLGAVLTLLVWRAYFTAPDGRLHITRMDYPAETVYFITTPGGSRLLVNGMSKPQETASLVGGQIFPFQPHLDAVILTVDKGVVEKGLPVFLAGSEVDQILELPSEGGPHLKTSGGLAATPLHTGQVYSIGGGGVMRVLQTGRGCADLEVDYGRLRVWLPQCRLPEMALSSTPGWSVISLSQSNLTKEDESRLARQRSGLVVAREGDPGILSHPNWLTLSGGSAVRIVSDGGGMSVSLAERK